MHKPKFPPFPPLKKNKLLITCVKHPSVQIGTTPFQAYDLNLQYEGMITFISSAYDKAPV